MGTRNLTLVWYKGKWHIAQYGQWDGYPDGQGRTIVKFITNTQEEEPEDDDEDVDKENVEHQPQPDTTTKKDTVATKDNITALKAAIDRQVLYTPTEAEITEWNEDSQKVSREASKMNEDARDNTNPNLDKHQRFQAYQKLWDAMSKPMMFVQPSMARDLGGQVLSVVAHAKDKVPIRLDLEFILDGLFCEWAYVVDLDEDVLEVYRGGYERHYESGPTGKGLVDPRRFRGLFDECKKSEEQASAGDKKSEPNLVASYRFEKLRELGVDGFIAEMK